VLYTFFKILIAISLRVFFRKYQVQGQEKLKAIKGPLIVVSNHPNTLIDPLIVATLMPQRVAFVANGSIFNKFTRPIFRYFNVIPVYRKKDMGDANNPLSQTELNKSTFKNCYEHLAKDGTILLFPEGTSELERRLRDIKTGTARIALGAEHENRFELGVKILPIGLNYSDQTRFRSEVFINVGEPIYLADFKEKYNPESFETVEALTELIAKKLSELSIVTEDEDEDSLVKNIEILYKNQLFQALHLPKTEKKHEFSIIKEIVAAVRYFEKHEPELFNKLQNSMNSYLTNVQKLGLSDDVFYKTQKHSISRQFWQTVFILITGFPMYVYGLINNYLPYILPSKLVRFISLDISYRGSILLTTGIVTFLSFYGLQIWGIQHFFGQPLLTTLYALSLPLSGYFALWYWGKAEHFGYLQRTRKIFAANYSQIKALLKERTTIFGMLERAKESYLFR
jgi:glycerol-3-phosphate O-acyltransferase / dihydroxyacetone phosphate acyltransferase